MRQGGYLSNLESMSSRIYFPLDVLCDNTHRVHRSNIYNQVPLFVSPSFYDRR